MTDFDVGDLLGDDSSKSKSKARDKSDDKKKKKSKDKDKSKSSSSGKKKSKSKSKKSAFDDDDFGNDDSGGGADDWTSSAKNWDSAAELEMAAAAAARRKNGGGKTGGGLDDEFAKMLGLDSGDVGSGANLGSAESPPLSPEPVTGLNRDDEKIGDDTFGISGYTPTMQRALARLTVSHQVQEEGSGYDSSAARVAAEDEARLRVIASLEGSSKRAAQHAEQERSKLAELLRELEAGARNARQGALEDKERLRQEQQRLDALSAHLQAQTAALRDQEAAHAAYMGKQLAETREDARVYEARLATRRTQLERDERALYEARAEFAAFREQTSLEIEREYEELRGSRLALEDGWRELRADREDLEAELASHEDEFQALESTRQEVQQAEARLAERTQEVVALAEKLDAGTRELLAREQLVAQQAAVVQDTDTSFSNRERTLERVKHELEIREQRLHAHIRQLDGARMRLTQQRREQQQLMAATRKQYPAERQTKVVVDNNKLWRQSEVASTAHRSNNDFNFAPPAAGRLKTHSWEIEQPIEEDPSGLPPALRKQVEANWLRRNQQVNQYRQSSSRKFEFHDFDAKPMSWSTQTADLETPNYSNKTSKVSGATKDNNIGTQGGSVPIPRQSVDSSKALQQQRSSSTPVPATSFHTPPAGIPVSHSAAGSRQPPPPPSLRSPGTFQPALRVNL
ncbi:uncharacterized protein IUM83_13211 [Phytophthora cinnamomi]|uniref:uncharacterized protein n=1 Tax=Phytophthora cinnamomi TaxID=4785 RepID=UPI0035595CDF|nr:hypothetical protein IUM83_13211 [Phytophthora cinnamomi]